MTRDATPGWSTNLTPMNPRPLRILFAAPVWAPSRAFGGPVVAAGELVRRLVARGNDVDVITTTIADLHSRPPLRVGEDGYYLKVRIRNVTQDLALMPGSSFIQAGLSLQRAWEPRGSPRTHGGRDGR